MDCHAFQQLAQAFVDGEFDGYEEAECRAHLDACPDCRASVDHRVALRELVRTRAGAGPAPLHLRASIQGALDRAPAVRPPGGLMGRPMPRWLSVGTALAASILLLIINVVPPSDNPGQTSASLVTDPIIEASVDWHRRNLPVEVTGPDASVVSDWFTDKVDFPVRLPHFDGPVHANMLGGRLNQLNNHSAAHVLYEVEGAKVSVILFSGANLRVPDLRVPDLRSRNGIRFEYYRGNRQGYNVALFRANGVTYAITTEMPQQSFNRLVSALDFNE